MIIKTKMNVFEDTFEHLYTNEEPLTHFYTLRQSWRYLNKHSSGLFGVVYLFGCMNSANCGSWERYSSVYNITSGKAFLPEYSCMPDFLCQARHAEFSEENVTMWMWKTYNCLGWVFFYGLKQWKPHLKKGPTENLSH